MGSLSRLIILHGNNSYLKSVYNLSSTMSSQPRLGYQIWLIFFPVSEIFSFPSRIMYCFLHLRVQNPNPSGTFMQFVRCAAFTWRDYQRPPEDLVGWSNQISILVNQQISTRLVNGVVCVPIENVSFDYGYCCIPVIRMHKLFDFIQWIALPEFHPINTSSHHQSASIMRNPPNHVGVQNGIYTLWVYVVSKTNNIK